jgi:N-acetylmuramoyl-L-alanine amidase
MTIGAWQARKTSVYRGCFCMLVALSAFLACSRRAPPVTAPEPEKQPVEEPPAPAPLNRPAVPPPTSPKLPPVPHVTGPLEVKVVYPKPSAVITAADSNFILGSVGNGDALLTINGVAVPVWPNGSFLAFLPVPAADPARAGDSIVRLYDLVAIAGTDTARVTHRIRLQAAMPRDTTAPPDTLIPVPISPPTYAILGATAAAVNDTDRVIIGRPARTGVYKWFFIPGTPVQVTGYRGGYGAPPEAGARVRLDSGTEIWVARRDLIVLPAGYRPPIFSGRGRISPQPLWLDFNVSAVSPPLFLVDQNERTITLTFYGVAASQDTVPTSIQTSDTYLASHTIRTDGTNLVHTFSFREPVFGYLPFWENGTFTLRMRRPPRVDATDPLKGLTIAVDPGHPPVGAMGPTGLWEPEGTLPVGRIVRDMLTQRGVNVVMTRRDMEPVELIDRTITARRANADAFVSIHLNAVPDGLDPFKNQGTSTYYFRNQSKTLARLTQEAMLEELGLRDLGYRFGNFAVVRNTWMPSVLCEGVFVIIPDQEAAMRNPDFQAAYARAIVKGLERYFATFTAAGP